MSPSAVPVRAPGKLFLLGEYAVLAGTAALVTTVDRHVDVKPRDDADGYEVQGARIAEPLRLPLAVRSVLSEQEDIDIDVNQLTVDVSDFYDDDTKLGIGSSAASTAAIVTATAPHLGARRRFEIGWEVHRRLQGGVGSGAGIATSIYGGPLAYRLEEPASPFDELDFDDTRLTGGDVVETDPATIDQSPSLPERLRIDAVWTGHSADSASFVDAVAAAAVEQPEETASALSAAARAAATGIEAARNGDADQFVDAIRDGDRAMEQLGALVERPIITDTHRRIRALGHTTHSVAKPSGAGGGDFTLLVSPADAPLPRPIEEDYLVISVV